MTNASIVPAVFERKARQSLASAQSEYANGRFDACANRCYYACFQAAVATLARRRTVALRRTADYTTDEVSQTLAERALRRARMFVQTVQAGGTAR